MVQPVLFLVMLAVGVMLVAVALILRSAASGRESGADETSRVLRACARCQYVNPPRAKFCTQCGAKLDGNGA